MFSDYLKVKPIYRLYNCEKYHVIMNNYYLVNHLSTIVINDVLCVSIVLTLC